MEETLFVLTSSANSRALANAKTWCGYPHGLSRGLELHSRKHGIKNQRWINRIRNVELVDFLVALGMVVQALEHHLLVLIGNRDVRDGRGIFNHFFGDLLRTLRLCLRP